MGMLTESYKSSILTARVSHANSNGRVLYDRGEKLNNIKSHWRKNLESTYMN